MIHHKNSKRFQSLTHLVLFFQFNLKHRNVKRHTDQVLAQKAQPLSSDPVIQIKLNITEMMKCNFFCNKIRLLNTTFFFIGKTLSHGGSLWLNLSICLQMATLKLRFFSVSSLLLGLPARLSVDAGARLSGCNFPHSVVSEEAALFTPTQSFCKDGKLKAIEANCANKSGVSVYANPPLILRRLPIHSTLRVSLCSVYATAFPSPRSPKTPAHIFVLPSLLRRHLFIWTSTLY